MSDYNPDASRVVAVFADRTDAERAARAAGTLVPGAGTRVNDPDDRLDALVTLQQRETEGSLLAISVGVMTGGQARGALVWGVGGILVGAAIGASVSLLVSIESMPRWVVALAFAFAGALAVSSATFVFGGARQSDVEGETRTTAGDVVVAVEVRGPSDEVRKVLVDAGAVEIIELDHPVARIATSDVEAPEAAGPPTGPASGHLMDD